MAWVTSRHMSAQHIGQHSPALTTRPQDQRGQSCFLFAPNTNLLSYLTKVSPPSKNCSQRVLSQKDPSHLLICFSVSGSKPVPPLSTMAAPVFSSLGFIRCLNVLLLALTGLSWSSPIRPPESHRRASVGRDVGDNPLLDAQDFMRHILSTLNLTELRPQPRPLAARKEPPEYMLELYNRFAHDRTSVPSANIVRSFKNEGTDLFCLTPQKVLKRLLHFFVS